MRSAAALLLLVLLAACAYQKPATTSRFALTGEVVKVDAARKAAEIKHGDIRDASGKLWMGAMTMEFPVKDEAGLARLRAGQQIRATVFQNDADLSYWLGGIEEVPKPPSGP